MSSARTKVQAAVVAGTLLAAGLMLAPAASATPSPGLVINEVYGGGGNSGAPLRNDFIELANRGATSIGLTGYSVQYAAAAGTRWSGLTALTGSIAPGARYLIQEAAGTGTGAALPTPQVTGTINLSGTAGTVALVHSTTTLTCMATSCGSDVNVVDLAGFGTAAIVEKTAAPAPSNTTSTQRSAAVDSDDNSADFTVAAPTPGAANAGTGSDCTVTPTPVACIAGSTSIQDLQGSGFVSPLKDQQVSKVAGVVTAVRNIGTARGYWIQQATPDAAKPGASSGVFVYTPPTVAVGDEVLVSGKVSDYYPLSSGETVASTSSLSTTEITAATSTVVSKNHALPAAVVLGANTVPDAYSPPVSGNIESITTVDPARSAQEFLEAHEGMLVQVNDARVVGPGKQQYGEIYVTSKPAQQATPRGGTYFGGYDRVPSGRLLVSPVNGTVPAANVGDVLSGATSGPVDWSTFGGYDIAATTVGGYVDNHLTATSATPQATDQLAVGTYNVENLAPSDAQSKYDRLGQGVVANLKSPDVISVEEIQDNSGATDDGVVAANQTLDKFIAAIKAAGGPTYTATEIDPTNDADGGQPGGNIRVVLLYNPTRVTFNARPGGGPTTGVTVSAAADGTAQLSASPARVDPTSSAWQSSRKPLAGEFVFGGKKVIVVANHFNSKGGDQGTDGRFQPPNRTSEVQRAQQATVLNAFVKQVQGVDPRANIVLAGDFNDYQFSSSITTLTGGGAALTDLVNTLPENERYTYVYNGVSQVLDHIFVNKALTDATNAVSYDVLHINSEFAAQASDHEPQVVRVRPLEAH